MEAVEVEVVEGAMTEVTVAEAVEEDTAMSDGEELKGFDAPKMGFLTNFSFS